ncbi:hypothetical protein [Amycolatopsis sp. cmx-4-61]|uniref:hypothetical protein n=1 Tax=Amycolatopsis sp. cmx-4-61 TaxID=2790937 RepID=UPI00397A1C45
MNDLVLGDVRELLACIYEAGVPIDLYEIAALMAPGSRQRVFRISARPRTTKSVRQREPDRD